MNKETTYVVINDDGNTVLETSPSKSVWGYDYTGFTKQGEFFRVQKKAEEEDYLKYKLHERKTTIS